MSTYPAIRIEGGLLGPETFDQLLAGELPGQRPEDFGLPAKTSLTDEIAAVFADARALWGVFQNRLQRVAESDPATSVTRDAWVIPFLGLLGYEPQYNTRAYDVDDRSLPISHRADGAADAPPLHIVGARQELGRVPESGRPRIAPHTLVQEYLNRTEQLWGIATNGLVLRLLRDCTFVRRQAYVEFDLHTIVEEQRFQDFAVLFRLLHRTRLPRGAADAADCLLEKYYAQSVEQGGRVRDHLRDGVKECITQLAAGFLNHPNNGELRARLAPGYTQPDRISPEKLYRELLRLVYRLLFLLVSEDRGILGGGRSALYREHYGVARLRRLADQRAAATDDTDLCESLRLLWRLLSNDQPQQGLDGRTLASLVDLPVLNGELFAPLALDDFAISNRDLLGAFWHLARYQENRSAPWRRVNYAALDVEELGSVYESLLDFHPALDHDAGRPAFDLLAGSERKTTGSYYTPPELVAELIKSALEPVLRERLAARPHEPEQAILSLRVCDPACGSGHFLLAAARRLGKELARVRTGHDEPPPEAVREAVRDVISHSIYGVDKNPLAVDLCQVALWLESHTAGKPLTFLRHRIRPGDSLVGVFDLATLADGIPDKAFEPRQGDDKLAARALVRRNRDERAGQRDLFESNREINLDHWTALGRQLDTIADDSPEAIRRKNALFDQAHADPLWRRERLACDLWTAAFFQPLTANDPAITSAALADVLAGKTIDPRVDGLAASIAGRQLFFHWPLEFPDAFADGGFDVVLGNPPWERTALEDFQFFATRLPGLLAAPTTAARKGMIRSLERTNNALYREYVDAHRMSEGENQFFTTSARFPRGASGRINTYALFSDLALSLTRGTGRAGIIVQTNIATDAPMETFWRYLVESGRLVSIIDFENKNRIFVSVHPEQKFCLLCVAGGSRGDGAPINVGFWLHEVTQLASATRVYQLPIEILATVSPNTTQPVLSRTRADLELALALYHRNSILFRTGEERPRARAWRALMTAGSSQHFRSREDLADHSVRADGTIAFNGNVFVPLIESKLIHQFDYCFATYAGVGLAELRKGNPRSVEAMERSPQQRPQPRFWAERSVVQKMYSDKGWQSNWIVATRDVTNVNNARTAIACVVPRVGILQPLNAVSCATKDDALFVVGAVNSFVVDFVARQRFTGRHLNVTTFSQLPIPPRERIGSLETLVRHAVLELTYTAWDLNAFAHDCGYDGPPFRWDDERRFEIRAELDAAMFHLYLPCEADGGWQPAERETPEQLAAVKAHFATPRDAVAHILEQFPLVRQRDEQAHGRYRTRDRILEIYDQMHAAQRAGRAYQTALDPPPGDPRAAHSPGQ